ncbi:MAG: tautomerase family protein [Spirochaetes bacterium]|nr:tautomerase family protein [Spirochaetota bacterium]
MPHVTVKLYPGRTEEQKKKLSEEILKNVVSIAGCEKKSVSVAIEEVNPEDWAETYKKEIMNNDKLYVKPGYDPFK